MISPDQFGQAYDELKMKLVLPIVSEHSTRLIGFLLASHFRRSRAVNSAVAYGLGGKPAPPIFAGADRDLLLYYRSLMDHEEVLGISEALYQRVLELQGEAGNIVHALQNDPLTMEQKAEQLQKLDQLENEMKRATDLLEGMTDG